MQQIIYIYLLWTALAQSIFISSNKTIVESENVRLMTFYAKMSAISYCPIAEIDHFDCKICRDSQMFGTHSIVAFNNSAHGVQGFVAVNDPQKTIILSIRGTQNKQNRQHYKQFLHAILFPDLLFFKRPLVHKGFLLSYNAIRSTIHKLLTDMCIRYPSYDITMTGHSLGGAIASLAALDAIKPGGYLSNLRHPSQINLYTMGAPRVGNRVVSSIVNDAGFGQVYRVVNYSDPVPHLPPSFVGYRHYKKEVFLDRSGTPRYCDDDLHKGEDRHCANKLSPLFAIKKNLIYHSYYFGVPMGRKKAC